MQRTGSTPWVTCLLTALILQSRTAPAQSPQTGMFSEMSWRMIGPHRGGRTKAAAGVPSRPGLFYVGAVNGGVWKTTDYGRTWRPIFDDQPTGSIGAIAVAPSKPEIIYVGSGEGLQRPDLSTGDGIYKSTDAGGTWTHLGLRDGQQIPQIVVDPQDPERLFVAVLGHPYGPNEERGVFRSTDGGRTFERVLYRGPDTGAADVALDPHDSRTVYAALWEARLAPWENGEFRGPGSGLYKSTDGGDTWRRLTGGLPDFAAGLGRIGIGVAPSDSKRLYATVEAADGDFVYRSDDAGESWRRICDDPRIAERASDFAEIKVDPNDADVVYSGSIVAWKSTDGGVSWTALRGAPGGDDYHRFWIDPRDPRIILLAGDQGVVISVNGGETWSSWYNQPTAQFYHVAADSSFPYRVCGGQQESGSACVSSRGDDGQITLRDWHPVGVDEYGYAAPDPLDPDIIYGGRVTRFDRRTGQVQFVGPKPLRGADYRVLRTAPVLFSPVDPHVLYFASNTVWKTLNEGRRWEQISPDLSRPDWQVPECVGKYSGSEAATPRRRGVVYTLAPSPLDENMLWAGTDDGLIHLTRDGGKTWREVTPPDLRPWAKVSLMDASHFDRECAYAAVNAFRLDDLSPHIYRTRDGGKTWAHITEGIPRGGAVNVVREDPVRPGLLFAGTEQAVYVSFDDGAHWQSLRLNMPATSIRDLIVKDNDLVVATHGRSFWILDDITPLRQHDAIGKSTELLAPAAAWRVRWNMNTDTPVPPEEPAGKNPPDGALLHYFLAEPPRDPVRLEILASDGSLVRRYSSADPIEEPLPGRNVPAYWLRPPQRLSTAPGLHRFTWDLRYAPPAVLDFDYPMTAITGDTPREPRGPWVLPGEYTVRLVVDGVAHTAPLIVRIDPRVQASSADIERQHAASMRLWHALAEDYDALRQINDAMRDIVRLRAAAQGDPAAALESLGRTLKAVAGGGDRYGYWGGGGGPDDLTKLNGQIARLLDITQDADAAPTDQAMEAIESRLAALDALRSRLEKLWNEEVPPVNVLLQKAGMELIRRPGGLD